LISRTSDSSSVLSISKWQVSQRTTSSRTCAARAAIFYCMFQKFWILKSQPVFSARCNIYISRLYYDVSVCLSVRLSVMFVYCGHRLRWISDTFACLDRWMSLLLTDNASPGSSDGMMPGFLVEEGGYEKLVIVALLLILLIFYRWTVST